MQHLFLFLGGGGGFEQKIKQQKEGDWVLHHLAHLSNSMLLEPGYFYFLFYLNMASTVRSIRKKMILIIMTNKSHKIVNQNKINHIIQSARNLVSGL